MGAPIPITLGAGASGVGAGFVPAVGAFPPLTINAGDSVFSATSDLSSTTDLAGPEEMFAGFVAVREPPLTALDPFSLSEEFEDRRVMSGCETGADVAAAVMAGVG